MISGVDPIRNDPGDEVDYTQCSTQDLMKKNNISDNDIIMCELDEKVEVETLVHTTTKADTSIASDGEGVEDPKINHSWVALDVMSKFSVHAWPGGDYNWLKVLTPEEKSKVREYEAWVQRRNEEQVIVE